MAFQKSFLLNMYLLLVFADATLYINYHSFKSVAFSLKITSFNLWTVLPCITFIIYRYSQEREKGMLLLKYRVSTHTILH